MCIFVLLLYMCYCSTKKAKALQNCVYVGREERLLVQSILESATFIADLVHFTEDTWR